MSQVYVVFEATMDQSKVESYLTIARSLEASLKQASGFVSIERYASVDQNGKVVSISIWEDEASVMKWVHSQEHMQAQQEGQKLGFDDYVVKVLHLVKTHSLKDGNHGSCGCKCSCSN